MAGLWVGDFMSGCLFRRRMFHSIFYYIKYIQFVSKSREKHVRVKTQERSCKFIFQSRCLSMR